MDIPPEELNQLKADVARQMAQPVEYDPAMEALCCAMDDIYQKAGATALDLVGLRLADGRLASLHKMRLRNMPYLCIISETVINREMRILPSTFKEIDQRLSGYTVLLGSRSIAHFCAGSDETVRYSQPELVDQADWLEFFTQQLTTARVEAVIKQPLQQFD